jgi:hypothetical protein
MKKKEISEIVEMGVKAKLIFSAEDRTTPWDERIDLTKHLIRFAKLVAAKTIAELESQEPVIDKSAATRIATSLGWSPQRTWVGLTDEETERLIHNFGSDPHTLLDEVDARLKARNT